MTDHYVESAWRLRHRLHTVWRAWKNPPVARAMLDAYDHGSAVVTVDCSTCWDEDGSSLIVGRRVGTMTVAIEPEPVLHILRYQVPPGSLTVVCPAMCSSD